MDIQTRYLKGKNLEKYIKKSVINYAEEMYKQGEFKDINQALKQSNNDIFKRYNEEINQHHIKEIIIDNQTIGIIWLRIINKQVHIIYLEIFEIYRGNKYGYQLMNIIDTFSKNNSLNMCFLYVFRDNKIALNLYKKCGFKIKKEVCLYSSTAPKRYYMEKNYVS